MMKNVAGFHSLRFGASAVSMLERDRSGFGTNERQKEGWSIRGR